ncbi:MAG: ABC transporter permease [Verrucomicrobiales bacterium]|nr:ABC transporter permease [Verrucomicrobiales bacterium]
MTDRASNASLPEAVYTPASPIRHPGQMVLAMGRDLVASRELAWRLFTRDFRAQYRQSVLGYFWAFVPPLLAALPWMFLNSQKIVNISPTGIPYPAFVMTGTMLWQTFIDALNSPLKQTLGARSMLAKINFPKEALLMAGVAEIASNLAIRMALLLPVLWVLKVPLAPCLAWAPIGVAALVLLGLSIGLLLTPLGLLYTDVARAIGVVATFGMLLTPVVYPPPSSGIGGWLAAWNPVSPVLSITRDWITGQNPSYPGLTVRQIRDAGAWVRRLQSGAAPADRWLWSQFPEQVQSSLTERANADEKEFEAARKQVLVTEINRILANPALFASSPFAAAPPGSSHGDALVERRLSVEHAFPTDLAPRTEARLLVRFWYLTALAFVTALVAWFSYRLTLPILVERMGG